MTLSTVTALAKLFGQYLLQPIPFTLTFLLPLLFRLIARKYIWLSLPLATLAEVLLNWDSFCYYEARGLALLFTLTQLAAMAVSCGSYRPPPKTPGKRPVSHRG